jgi:glucosamine--fructose-6-phosphate aminotransferase (isomerizing)
MGENTVSAGHHMATEIAEQPRVLDAVFARRSAIAQVAEVIAKRRPRFVLLAARGSSDHAAIYAKYLIEVLLGLPAGLVSPSTITLYQAKPDWQDALLLAVSQSGGSPDLVEVTDTARKQGALTVSVSNTPSSLLDATAELNIDIGAGVEQAVAATKTYSATLLSLYLLIDAIAGGNAEPARKIGSLAQRTIDVSQAAVFRAIDRYRFVNRIVTSGRGYSYATALEAALKLAETSYLSARAYSGADLLHGPVAAIDEETAVLAIMSKGRGGEAMKEVVATIARKGADVITVGSVESVDKSTAAALHIPVLATAEELSPVLEILPIQSLALGLALARGGNPDHPRGLNKVTKTR